MKTMKKWMAIFLAALCVTMTGAALANEQEAEPVTEETVEANVENAEDVQDNLLTGTILEIDAELGEVLVENAEMGEVLVRFEAELLEGLPTLYPGVTVTFETTGIATMSLPAQMNAVSVEAISLQGTVLGFEDGMLLVDSGEMGVYAANLGAGPRVYGLEHFGIGAKATVFFNGMMTRSIPAQVVAQVVAFEAAEEALEETEEVIEEAEEVEETEETEAEEEAAEESEAK